MPPSRPGGLHYVPGSVEVRHLLDVIVNDIGLDEVGEERGAAAEGLRVAPYLGCMVPRPDYRQRCRTTITRWSWTCCSKRWGPRSSTSR